MGFYIRKGFNFGPFRLNLSRSGLGASFGVKGARIGTGPRGSYVHLGRGGLYYRQTLTPASTQLRLPGQTVPQPLRGDKFLEIASAPATTIVDSSAPELLQELNRVKQRPDLFPIVAIIGGLILLVLLENTSWLLWSVALWALSTLAICVRHHDVTNSTAVLRYSFDEDVAKQFSNLQTALRQLSQCEKLWHVPYAERTDDWKRNSGVGVSLGLKETQLTFSLPPKVSCNIKVPMLKASQRALYFFPDRLLVYDSGGVGAVSYENLQAHTEQTRFVEQGSVPSDAEQVATTWRFVNKNGGPDLRFSNNHQLPVMLYGKLGLGSDSGLFEMFLCSCTRAAIAVTSAIADVRAERIAAKKAETQ